MKIQIIVGTTRQNRFSEKAASYIYQEAVAEKAFDAEIVDLKDYPMPFFDEPVSPRMFETTGHAYTHDVVKKWLAKIAQADGYIFVTGEYNHGYPAVLKNAIDFGLREWSKKSAGFVSYGNAGGARAVEQLRQVTVELDMVQVKSAVQIPSEVYMAVRGSTVPVNPEIFAPLRAGHVDRIKVFFDDLIWTTNMLISARKTRAS